MTKFGLFPNESPTLSMFIFSQLLARGKMSGMNRDSSIMSFEMLFFYCIKKINTRCMIYL